MLPRKKGFTATIEGNTNIPKKPDLKRMIGLHDSVDAVYDLTIAYQDGNTYRPPLSDVVLRKGVKVHLHVRRFPIKDVPTNEADLDQWLNKVWKVNFS